MCDCIFTVFKIDLTFDQRTPGPAYGSVYCTAGRIDAAADDRQVFPRNLMADAHTREDAGAYHVFCDHGQAGSIPVEAVCAPKDEWLALLLIIVHQSVGKRVTIVVKGWMDRHPGRFVYHDDVLILINDIKRRFTAGMFGEDSVSRMRTVRTSPPFSCVRIYAQTPFMRILSGIFLSCVRF